MAVAFIRLRADGPARRLLPLCLRRLWRVLGCLQGVALGADYCVGAG